MQILFFFRRLAFGIGIVSLASVTTLGSFSLLLRGMSSPPTTDSATSQKSEPLPQKVSLSSLIFAAQKTAKTAFSPKPQSTPLPKKKPLTNYQLAAEAFYKVSQASPPLPPAKFFLPNQPNVKPSPTVSPSPSPSPTSQNSTVDNENAIATRISPSPPQQKSGFKPPYQRTVAALKTSNESESNASQLKLTLEDAVFLALQNNRELKNAYLDRIIDRQDLAIAKDKFVPNFTPEITTNLTENRIRNDSTTNADAGISAGISMALPTGGNIQVFWQGRRDWQETTDNNWRQNINVSIEQPLLRGSGIDVNRASIEQARLQEKGNVLQLKNTLIGKINEVIGAYRSLIQAQQALQIQQRGLESAQRQLEVTQALIDAGRQPRVDIINSETTLANRQVALQGAENRLQSVQLQLLEILDIQRPRNTQIVAVETPSLESTELKSFLEFLGVESINSESLTMKKLLPIALANNPNYLQAKLQVATQQLNLLLAKNERLWQLDVTGGYSNNLDSASADTQNFQVGIQLQREFGNLNLEQSVQRAKINLEQIQNNLQERREQLEIELQNSLRDVRFQRRQVDSQRRALELVEQELENEREKLRLGVSNVSIIDIGDLEDDVVEARNQELQAIISYLNELTDLQATLGTTLKHWGVSVEATGISEN
jgi:outer membrane protein TolC